MKRKNIYLIVLFALAISGCSIEKKTVIKIYAYSQQTLPGMIQKIRDENNGEVKQEYKSRINYFLYAENLKESAVTISDAWIDSVHYLVRSEKITTTPVEISTDDGTGKPQKKQLVPKTLHEVFRLTPVSTTDADSRKNKVRKITGASQLVLGFTYKGRKYFHPVQKMDILQPVITQ